MTNNKIIEMCTLQETLNEKTCGKGWTSGKTTEGRDINWLRYIRQEIANLKEIALKAAIDPELYYDFSKTKLQRIVDNTISNAIKYSHMKTSIEIKLFSEEESIVFLVKDYGVGIENVKKIFSRYYREDEAKGGFGIGLNIVKHIIDEENILLDVTSALGEGTIFQYTFLKDNKK